MFEVYLLKRVGCYCERRGWLQQQVWVMRRPISTSHQHVSSVDSYKLALCRCCASEFCVCFFSKVWMGIVSASFYTCDMMLVFRANIYRRAQEVIICFTCMIVSDVELLILVFVVASWISNVVTCIDVACGFVNVSVYYSVCIAMCMFYCVCELFVEYV